MVSIVIVILALLLVFTIPFFLIYNGLVYKGVSKRGIPLFAKVVDVKIIKDYDDDGNVISFFKKIICEFNYDGENRSHELFASLDKVKKGDSIECIYDVKKDILTTKESAQSAAKVGWLFFGILLFTILIVPLMFVFVFLEIVLGDIFSVDPNIFILAIACLFFIGISIYILKKSKISEDSVCVRAKVVDIFKQSNSDGGGYVFSPIFEYEFNNEVCTHQSSFYSSKSKFKVGDETDIYCNPVTGFVIEKKESEGSRKFAIFIIVFCVVIFIYGVISLVFGW